MLIETIHWKSVDVELPDAESRVLIRFDRNDGEGCVITEAEYDDSLVEVDGDIPWMVSGDWMCFGTVTHWAEMPACEKSTNGDLWQMIEKGAERLPEAWELAIDIERGYAGVVLIDPYGDPVSMDDFTSCDSDLSTQIEDAIAHAIANDEEYT